MIYQIFNIERILRVIKQIEYFYLLYINTFIETHSNIIICLKLKKPN